MKSTYPEGRLDYTYHLTTGKLASITRADGHRLDYTYDGFLPLSETATGEVSGTIARTYDNNFWLNSQINGVVVKYSPASRLDYIWDGFPPLIETATGEVNGTVRP